MPAISAPSPASAAAARELRAARASTVVLFATSGMAFAWWVVSIPGVQQRLGLTHAVLGSLLLLLGLGSFLGMSAAGSWVDRVGSRRVAVPGALVMAAGLAALATAPNAWVLGIGLVVFGLGHGVVDVAMNDQAVLVERGYGRPIMASFHAYFSLGALAGSLLGALTQALGVGPAWLLGLGAVAVLPPVFLAVPTLLRRSQLGATLAGGSGGPRAGSAPGAAPSSDQRRRLALLAALAFLLMLAEGSANDWSALHTVEHLGLPVASGSVAYAVFAGSMVLGRFVADPVVRRLGPVRVVRYGAALAAASLALVVFSPRFALTLLGWGLFGLGVAGLVPQIFTAAGALGGAEQGKAIARVVGAGYLGMLAGPALVGWLAPLAGLGGALLLPLACCVVGVALAGELRARAAGAAPDAVAISGR